ncbi:class I SAM-dependent methyltransferase [Siminovitchia terrae]|uniref:Class I SAM-dependent methyltransferase n=2 Tax=Siminovitchia terrae TaxID=1914933 RepID=A0A429X6R3_SIMTE|nr:class I SAM-dependent methyltransferase [Siminovitchia terrae]
MKMNNSTNKPDYGIDAPGVIRNLSLISVAGLVLAFASFWLLRMTWQWAGWIFGVVFSVTFVVCLAESIYMFWGSKVGKLYERERLLDLVDIEGDEKILDIGCGRGLLLNAAAQRPTTGRAVGLDIWNRQDQSGNHPDATRKNAQVEGVLEKIDIIDGDFRNMPFEQDTFDIVVSSLAIHNVRNIKERRKALKEVVRVLKPGGRFAILDFQHVKEYAQVFKELEMAEVSVIGPHYLLFPPVRIVIGQKPIG